MENVVVLNFNFNAIWPYIYRWGTDYGTSLPWTPLSQHLFINSFQNPVILLLAEDVHWRWPQNVISRLYFFDSQLTFTEDKFPS